MKFGTQMQIWKSVTVIWPDMRIFKIQDGGRPPYWKSFWAISQQPIGRLQWNFAWGCRVFHRISAERISCFPTNAVWASASGAFRIVSDRVVLNSEINCDFYKKWLVPWDELDEVVVEWDACSSVEDAAEAACHEVRRDDLVLSVAKDALHRSICRSLHRSLDLVIGCLSSSTSHRTSCSRRVGSEDKPKKIKVKEVHTREGA